ncbi:Calcium-binding protein [Melia azedarach]|uniref:Calcium-binding protein n=1 Tax=Melia azedarach TaxID=155640 RepID=A0ACC1WU15_MELAZ|nr:Calcium-binding protein [Melia azedarach]
MKSEAAFSSNSTDEKQSPKRSSFGRLCRKLSPKRADKCSTRDCNDAIEISTSSNCSSSGELQKVFDFFDENGDGRISAAELHSCLRTVGGELSMEDAEAAVQSSDLNGDGVLDFNEFQKLIEGSSANEDEKNKELRDAFKMYVMEDSSYITPASLRRMLKRLGESRSVDDCKAMIRAFDLNGDGVLSFEEFAIMMH